MLISPILKCITFKNNLIHIVNFSQLLFVFADSEGIARRQLTKGGLTIWYCSSSHLTVLH